jgi:hypothetical protein
MYVYIHVCTCIYINIYKYIDMYTYEIKPEIYAKNTAKERYLGLGVEYLNLHICLYMYVCMYVCMYVLMYIYIYIYMYIYIYVPVCKYVCM